VSMIHSAGSSGWSPTCRSPAGRRKRPGAQSRPGSPDPPDVMRKAGTAMEDEQRQAASARSGRIAHHLVPRPVTMEQHRPFKHHRHDRHPGLQSSHQYVSTKTCQRFRSPIR
jgi:hypothetical protein